MPYIKINYKYPYNECVNLTRHYTLVNGGEQFIDYNHSCYSLMNGTSIAFAAGSNPDGINRMSFFIIINANKKRRVVGRDVFSFSVINNENGYYIGAPLYIKNMQNIEKIREYCASPSGRINIAGGQFSKGGFCTELIKRNGWKIPANYPIKF